MKSWKWMSMVLVICLLLGNTMPFYAAEASEAEKLQEQIEQLESEKAELEEQVKLLSEENAALKEQLAESGKEETTVPEVPENVANADTSVEYSSRNIVIMVQQALNEKGYNCGTADGIAGSKTRESISSYQKDHGIEENGIITDQLLESLELAEKVSAEAKKEAEKAAYRSDYSYEQLARNPETYIGEQMKFSGKVLQAETGTTCYIRLAIKSNYDTVLFVTYDKSVLDYKLLEDDKVTVYGTFKGDYSYKAVLGNTITIPWLSASMIELD